MILRWRVTRPLRLIDAVKEQVDPSFSARRIKKAFESNICRVNGKIERFASVRLQQGDRIELNMDFADFPPRKAPLRILFENDDLLAVDKPAGIVSMDSSLQQWLQRKAYLAHRLDKDTTGVLLLGKTVAAAEKLQDLFEKRGVEKEYWAIVDGCVGEDQGEIQSRLFPKKAFQGQTIWGSHPAGNGLLARTRWRTLSFASHASLLQCMPLTGRTHQIRVHLAEMGHPILIDRQYGSIFRAPIFASRPLLHARKLSFSFGGQRLDIASPLPEDFQHALHQLGLNRP